MNTLITLTGPTCSGKSHLQDLLTGAAHRMGTVITATTRPPRKGEHDGTDYHFWTDQRFADAHANDLLVESAAFSGAQYGTPLQSLRRAFADGRGCAVQVIEPQGLKLLHKAFAQRADLADCRLLPVFVDCNMATVAARFMKRYRADLGEALAKAPGSIEAVTTYYERRLVSILTVEVDWRREAMNDQCAGHPLYRVIVDEFGAETEDHVVKRILRAVA